MSEVYTRLPSARSRLLQRFEREGLKLFINSLWALIGVSNYECDGVFNISATWWAYATARRNVSCMAWLADPASGGDCANAALWSEQC
jgi:hypothetical protein